MEVELSVVFESTGKQKEVHIKDWGDRTLHIFCDDLRENSKVVKSMPGIIRTEYFNTLGFIRAFVDPRYDIEVVKANILLAISSLQFTEKIVRKIYGI